MRQTIEELEYRQDPTDILSSFADSPYSFFLDSSFNYKNLGRFSYLGCDPFLVFKSKRDAVRLEWDEGRVENFNSNPFAALKNIFKHYSFLSGDNKDMPFTSGGVGYFSYDLKDFVEELPSLATDDLKAPDSIFAFYDCVIVYDNLKRRSYIVGSGKAGQARLKKLKRKILDSGSRRRGLFNARHPRLKSNFSKEAYMEAVRKAKLYIKRGDIYQVNLSQRFETTLDMEPLELYSRLRTISPAPFASYLNFRDVVILSSSPERFLLKRGDYIETRPIKGTRPRGQDILSDLALEKELIESKKDRAEHIMIVDLERNDLGRICRYESIEPSELIGMERYSNVFHLVSTVGGRLKKNIDAIDCLLAVFPGGSITGAPKIRAMEIIEELEGLKRSIYTGAIGYISFDGNMDTSIAIRTILIKDKKAYFSVGGGIVADSDPEEEYAETMHKARGLMEALGVNENSKELIAA